MENEHLIPADEFCMNYRVEHTFIEALGEAGLIEMVMMEEKIFLHEEQLAELERFCRLHYELDINMEGIEAIAHLLKRVNDMEHELFRLRQRVKGFSLHNNASGE